MVRIYWRRQLLCLEQLLQPELKRGGARPGFIFQTRTLQQLTLGHQLANIASCNIDLGGFYCSTATYCTATGENLIGKIRNVETEKICKSLCRSSKVQNQ